MTPHFHQKHFRAPTAYILEIKTSKLHLCCKYWALLGGLFLLGIAGVSVLSILGRQISGSVFLQELGFLSALKPIKGDFELVELGGANAVFAFLPYCHIQNKNFSVDLISRSFYAPIQKLLEILSHLLYSVLASLFTWQLYLNLLDKAQYQQRSMVLGIPLEWAYFPATCSLLLLSFACYSTTLQAVMKLFRPIKNSIEK